MKQDYDSRAYGVREYGSLRELLDDFDVGRLNEPWGSGLHAPNGEQCRFIGSLNKRYGIDSGLEIHAAIHQLLTRVVDELDSNRIIASLPNWDGDGR